MSSAVLTNPEQGGDLAANDLPGSFVNRAGERFYCIRDVDDIPPFFISVVSSDDHWLFVSSTGGLTAGRVSPETALFPYVPVDRIHESLTHTGPRTILRLHHTDGEREWAYDRKSSVGGLDKGLDEAQAKGWTIVDMKQDWKVIYPHEKK